MSFWYYCVFYEMFHQLLSYSLRLLRLVFAGANDGMGQVLAKQANLRQTVTRIGLIIRTAYIFIKFCLFYGRQLEISEIRSI